MNSTSPAALSTIPAPPSEPIKVCSCCHRVVSGLWEALPYVGMQDDGDGGWLELRNCVCGTTLAVETQREPRGWEVA